MISVHPVQCAWSPVVEQVWGWGAGGAESSGVTHVLGLYSARWCQPGKGKAWFSPGRISQDVVSCINGGAGTGPVGRSDGGRSYCQERDQNPSRYNGAAHVLLCFAKKKHNKRKANKQKRQTGRKYRFHVGLGPSGAFILCFPTPSLLHNKPGSPKEPRFPR